WSASDGFLPPSLALQACRDDSSLNHSHGPHPRHLLRQPRLMYDLDHIIDILVRLGLLLRESLAALRPSNDAACFQFLIDAPAGRVLDGGGAAHGAARAVAGGAKGFLHAARLTDQHPTRASHIAGDD